MGLEKYRVKRSAEKTPEPFGGRTRPGRQQLFVVQKHAARALHYDFRLEWEGVLKSWAVPKGPSRDPAEKRLAVEVEDHPVEYADFEGIIPEGNYGAGAVIVWDQGRWIPLEEPSEGYRKGKLLFELKGYKLRGVWTLVRTKRKGAEASTEWLLIKKPDAWSKAGADGAYPQESIFSGLAIDELRSSHERGRELRAELETMGAPRRRVKGSDAGVMLAELREKAFTDPDWIWELKYDGYRVLAEKREGASHLYYRRGLEATATFPEVARALLSLPFEGILLDGEAVVLDEEGRPSFQRLQQRALLQRSADIGRATVELPATLYAFDLLGFEDFDLRPLPLLSRKRVLRRILPGSGPLRYADHIEEKGDAFLEEAARAGLEGIVGKQGASSYRAGRSADWIKIRLDRTGDFVVVGYTEPRGSRSGFGALHLAAYEGETLVYAGRVGTGFREAQLIAVRALLKTSARREPACSGTLPATKSDAWTEPRLVCEVRFKEWTREGLMRQPVFLRFREDKRPEECLKEGRVPSAAPVPAPAEPVPVERVVAFSNLGKVFWPEEGYTKGDLIEYYRAIAPWLLPYLRDRPIVMTRYPDGIAGKSFFQKDAPSFAPGWVRTERIWSEHAEREIDYFVCDDVATLLYVVNLGSIPLHVWSSRVDALDKPDWCILDLDPKGAPFSHVVTVALAIRTLCDAIELPSFVKTSGATGLHVLLPLGGRCTYAESRSLGEILARAIERELPEIATTTRAVGARGGRVYVDFLQNGHGRTIAGLYSARPLPGAPASAPLAWREVNARLDPRRFTIRTLPGRMRRLAVDPVRDVLTLRPELPAVLERLQRRLAR